MASKKKQTVEVDTQSQVLEIVKHYDMVQVTELISKILISKDLTIVAQHNIQVIPATKQETK